MEMNLEMAKQILRTAFSKAEAMGKVLSIAVVDEKGWLVALQRMDGAPIPTAEVARDKAWTAATFRVPSSEVSQFGDPNVLGYGFNAQNWNERLTTIPGGLPIWKDGQVIGAIGVCGETPKEDVTLCQNILKDIFGEERYLKPKKRVARKKYGRR
jgi:glc operon protein GlcG